MKRALFLGFVCLWLTKMGQSGSDSMLGGNYNTEEALEPSFLFFQSILAEMNETNRKSYLRSTNGKRSDNLALNIKIYEMSHANDDFKDQCRNLIAIESISPEGLNFLNYEISFSCAAEEENVLIAKKSPVSRVFSMQKNSCYSFAKQDFYYRMDCQVKDEILLDSRDNWTEFAREFEGKKVKQILRDHVCYAFGASPFRLESPYQYIYSPDDALCKRKATKISVHNSADSLSTPLSERNRRSLQSTNGSSNVDDDGSVRAHLHPPPLVTAMVIINIVIPVLFCLFCVYSTRSMDEESIIGRFINALGL